MSGWSAWLRRVSGILVPGLRHARLLDSSVISVMSPAPLVLIMTEAFISTPLSPLPSPSTRFILVGGRRIRVADGDSEVRQVGQLIRARLIMELNRRIVKRLQFNFIEQDIILVLIQPLD